MPGGMGRKNGKKCRNKFCAVKEDGSVITNPAKQCSRFRRTANAGKQCPFLTKQQTPIKHVPDFAERQMLINSTSDLPRQQTPVQRTGVCLLMLPFFYSCRCGICASSRRALTKSLSFITSCLSEPRRRTVTVPFSFSLAPTTAMTGILATECSRIL